MDPFERLGRLYHDYLTLRAEYSQLLALVGRLQAGEVDLEEVVVLPGDAWEIRPTPGVVPLGSVPLIAPESLPEETE